MRTSRPQSIVKTTKFTKCHEVFFEQTINFVLLRCPSWLEKFTTGMVAPQLLDRLKSTFVEEKKISHYTILSKIGSGGMGEVYLAQDQKLDRTVALKILPAEFASDPARMHRFVQEAKAASALDHPNVAHIYEIGESDGTNFIAMQYIEGTTLDAYIKDRQLQSNEILDIAIQVADALDVAGSKGITHRDIKSANIMITPRGQIKVLDFGLAKVEQRTASQPETSKMETAAGTTPGLILGTVQYMSPEQALGKPVDHRSDIYSLGVVMYQLATAKLPFSGSTSSDTLNRILNSQPEAIARFNYNIDPALEHIIRKCMEKDPDRRYQSARELLIDLKNLKRDTESGSRPELPARPAPKNIMRYAVVVGILAAVIAGLYYFRSWRRSEIRSLAVLPFVNANANTENEWLGDGITETTINSLSQIPDLKVMARSTVDRYKGKSLDPQKAGRDLKVDAVLTGNVSQQGDDLVIGTELVKVADGSLIWGENYRNKISDLVSMQRAISEKISDELRTRLTGEQKKVISKQFSVNPEAYQLYLKGRFFWNKRGEEDIKKAIELFNQAISKDPSYALAYVGLADCYVVKSSPFSREVRLKKGTAAANKALELEPTLAEAYVSLGAAKELDWDWKGAEKLYRKAIEINPNYPTAHQWLSEILVQSGRTEEGLNESRMALELDPLSTIMNVSLAANLYFARKFDEAIAQCRKTIELDPDSFMPRERLIQALLSKKEFTEAFSEYEKLIKIYGVYEEERAGIEAVKQEYLTMGEEGFWKKKLELDLDNFKKGYGTYYNIAINYSMLRDNNSAFLCLEKSVQARELQLDELKVDPRMDPLRSDPRFNDYLRRVNLE
jgi:serine/threonine protein kinase/Tfp pilus assembly protein PilF